MGYFFDFVRSYSRELIGPDHSEYDPLFVGIFFFIFVSNLWGLVPGMLSPTANLNTNFSIAIIVFLATHFYGMRKQGVLNYLNQFAGPVPGWLKPLMFFIEIISHVARPVSLAFRLFGNIVAKEILLLILATLVLQFGGSTQLIGQALAAFPILLYPLLIVLGALRLFYPGFCFHVARTGVHCRCGERASLEFCTESCSTTLNILSAQEDTIMKNWLIYALTLVASVVFFNDCAFAEEAAEAAKQVIPESNAAQYFVMTVLAAGAGITLATCVAGLAQSKMIAKSVEGMARQPEAASKIQTAMIIGLAFIESLVIYVLLIALILVFLNPFADFFVQAVQ
ncbi:MAG: F0F1 ATP synthase subunit A [Planctomycetota bacterium]|nr:F0F1 ATP synthase subunit A [Planctomycetota bacterium]